jgi:UDP:flavonoid glycosyltransferase YjiC (YdhE family)
MLLPKPKDWGRHISVSGFFILPSKDAFTPPPDLLEFLEAGDPPIYIGFGSIVVDDSEAMTSMVFEAIRQAGVRAVVSKGWGGLGTRDIEPPSNVFLLGSIPHTWLFERVSAVVHHGGAGTTAAGLLSGKPTVIVPFFGDVSYSHSLVEQYLINSSNLSGVSWWQMQVQAHIRLLTESRRLTTSHNKSKKRYIQKQKSEPGKLG